MPNSQPTSLRRGTYTHTHTPTPTPTNWFPNMDRFNSCAPQPTPQLLGTLSPHRWSGLTMDAREPKSSGNSTLESFEKPNPNIAPFSSKASKAWRYLNAPVRPCGFVELQLIIITFCTGLQGQQSTFLPSKPLHSHANNSPWLQMPSPSPTSTVSHPTRPATRSFSCSQPPCLK